MAETKLLHTLHWMLLEAPQECPSGFGQGFGSGHGLLGNQSASPPSASTEEDENVRFKLYQRSMATVELFIFLFAPLINRIKVRGTGLIDFYVFGSEIEDASCELR